MFHSAATLPATKSCYKPASNPCAIQLPLYWQQKAVINLLPTLVPFNCHSTSNKKLLPFPFWKSLQVQGTKKLITFTFLWKHPGSKAVIFPFLILPPGSAKLSFFPFWELLEATKSCRFPLLLWEALLSHDPAVTKGVMQSSSSHVADLSILPSPFSLFIMLTISVTVLTCVCKLYSQWHVVV